MHPENFPNSINIGDKFCIADVSCEISTPLEQMEVLKLQKMIGVPMTYKGPYAGSMILAMDSIGPIILQLKYLERITKLSQEEVDQFDKLIKEFEDKKKENSEGTNK